MMNAGGPDRQPQKLGAILTKVGADSTLIARATPFIRLDCLRRVCRWIGLYFCGLATGGRGYQRRRVATNSGHRVERAVTPRIAILRACVRPRSLPSCEQQLVRGASATLRKWVLAAEKDVEWWRKNAKSVRPGLRAQLEDDKEDLMSDDWAIRILGDIGDPADIALIDKVLRTYHSEITRMAAAAALAKFPQPEALDALVAATNGSDEDTASYAATALGERKDDADKARAQLEHLLSNPSAQVRERAVNALGKFGGSKQALMQRRKIEKNADGRQAIDKTLKAQ